MWSLPATGIEPESPALVGRFFTTEPPGKSLWWHFVNEKILIKSILRTSEKWTSQLKHRMKLQTTVIRKSTLWLGGFPDDSAGKESTYNAGDTGDARLIPGLEGSPGGGNGNPLQYSCLRNPTEPGWLQSKVSKGVGHDWAHHTHFVVGKWCILEKEKNRRNSRGFSLAFSHH